MDSLAAQNNVFWGGLNKIHQVFIKKNGPKVELLGFIYRNITRTLSTRVALKPLSAS